MSNSGYSEVFVFKCDKTKHNSQSEGDYKFTWQLIMGKMLCLPILYVEEQLYFFAEVHCSYQYSTKWYKERPV